VNVYFHTFGCKANQYDTEVVRQAFADQGAVVVAAAADADLAVVNSCTVTGEAEAKLRHYVRRLGRAGCSTVVMGCAAARDGPSGAIAALPGVRAVVGGADPAAVLRAAGYRAPRVDSVLRRFAASSRGWLKIQDGCDEHCTFCATTIARGANRWRSIAELVEEAIALSEHHAELVLTGVHIGTYGHDRGSGLGTRGSEFLTRAPSPEPQAPSLGRLLEALIAAVPVEQPRLAQDPGRLRRALHLLCDDHRTRGESVPARRRADRGGDGARRISCRAGDHRYPHRHLWPRPDDGQRRTENTR